MSDDRARPQAVDIRAVLAPLPVLRARQADMAVEDTAAAFAVLAETENGGVFAGSFQGESPWERHRNGDELVQVLDGATRLTIITEAGWQVLELSAGMMTIVPRGCWHRFRAPDQVTVMTMTPQPTDHSDADDPTAE